MPAPKDPKKYREWKRKLSESHKGKMGGTQHPKFGKPLSKEARKKISVALTGRFIGEKNPFFGKTHSQEVRDKLSKINKGKKLSKETRQKMSLKQKGRVFSEEHKRNLRNVMKRLCADPEHRKKLSASKKGQKNPNYGKPLSKNHKAKLSEASKLMWTNPDYRLGRSEDLKRRWRNPKYQQEMTEKMSGEGNPQFGKKGELAPWYGKHHSQASKRKISEATHGRNKGKKWEEIYGEQRAKELRGKHSQSLKGIFVGSKNPMYGKTHSKEIIDRIRVANTGRTVSIETRRKLRRATIRQLGEGRMPGAGTKIEVAVKNELLKRGYKEDINGDFVSQFPFREKFCCDFAFPKQKLIIECQGDYWHAHPAKYGSKKGLKPLNDIQKRRMIQDNGKYAYIEKCGWKILIFWGSEIQENVKACVDRIEDYLR